MKFDIPSGYAWAPTSSESKKMTNESPGFRPIHYLGNKTRYLEPIVTTLVELSRPGQAVLDLFAGSAVVSRELALHRPVVSADVQAYSAALASALSNPRRYSNSLRRDINRRARDWLTAVHPRVSELLSYESRVSASAIDHADRFASFVEEASLASAGATDPQLAHAKAAAYPHLIDAGATLTRYYGGAYFAYEQSLELDALIFATGHGPSTPAEATLLASILGTASDIVSTVGSHFAQPSRLRDRSGTPKLGAIAQVIRARQRSALDTFELWLERYANLTPAPHVCTTITGDFRAVLDALDDSISAIYADPPYTRDHYSRFYHVLETITLADDPGVTLSPGSGSPSRGLYRSDRHQSPFSIRSRVTDAFDTLFSSARKRGIPLVLSYSPQGGGTPSRPETRLMTVDRLVRQAESHFRHVKVREIEDSSHSRFNRAELHGTLPAEAEVLVIARP
ncbi:MULTISPECIES: DNA adenine methylase [unclassified Microbacterium]|uniref:DNA adenine methylase n=1 Tax=unclassified Microbacterium TaxID=2609290 RepID=UPI0030103FED